MTNEELFAAWAPDASPWSPWAKPALFAQCDRVAPATPLPPPPPWLERVPPPTDGALVLELPGEEAVTAGLALAARGWRPVPLFNATLGPTPVLDVARIAAWFAPGATLLAAARLPDAAPPAFLLDAGRCPAAAPAAGAWDNRWLVFPQDLPSATRLRAQGIARALVLRRGSAPLRADLVHVLKPWQEGGLALAQLDVEAGGAPAPLDLPRPSRFRALTYRALALLGLRRGNVGGFGAQVPVPRPHGAGFYG